MKKLIIAGYFLFLITLSAIITNVCAGIKIYDGDIKKYEKKAFLTNKEIREYNPELITAENNSYYRKKYITRTFHKKWLFFSHTDEITYSNTVYVGED